MSRFDEMTAFVSVVEAGSFSLAADRMSVAKSAVSRRVADLEKRLGAKLIHRTTRRLKVTDAGRGFYQRVARVLKDVEEAEQVVACEQVVLTGRVRVACPMSFGLKHLAPLLADFLKQHPELSLDLDLNDRHVDLVDEGFDLAVRIGRLEDSSLVARRLNRIRFVCVASPDYLERVGRPETPADLATHRIIRYSNVSPLQGWIFADASGREWKPKLESRIVCNNGEAMLQAAQAGLGIVIQPEFIAYQAIREGRVNVLLPEYELRSVGLFLIYPPGRFLTRRVRVLADYLAKQFSTDVCWEHYSKRPAPLDASTRSKPQSSRAPHS